MDTTYHSWLDGDDVRHLTVNDLPLPADNVALSMLTVHFDECDLVKRFLTEPDNFNLKTPYAWYYLAPFTEHLAQLGAEWILSDDDIERFLDAVDHSGLGLLLR